MKAAWVNSIGLISNVVLIISVIVLILEIRQNQTSMLAQSSYERTRMAIANEHLNLSGANEIRRRIRQNEVISDEDVAVLKARDSQLMRYFENLHYLNSIGVLDTEIWEANVRGIELFCRYQKEFPSHPVVSKEGEFRFRSSFIAFWKGTCGLE
ncbi:MAG: hypothetical protein PVJ93_08020 [Pseudomonadales bacterium]|jgi:hypothetical protein